MHTRRNMTPEDNPVTDRTRAGRPPDERKYQAILDSARKHFADNGYAATSIERIASGAAVSKVTIYNRFGDKAGLLEALVRRQAETMKTAIHAANREAPELETKLVNFGTTLLAFLFHGDHYHFDAMLSGLTDSHPETTRRFFDAGPGTMRSELAKVIEEAAQRGDLSIDDPVVAAEDLVSLWKGFKDVELRFGVAGPQSVDAIRSHVEHGIAVFLRAYAARN